MNKTTLPIAYFISPHGYGHAARAAAVMEAIHRRRLPVKFEIFTRVPAWFFQDSLSQPFGYHETLTDIGLVQKTPLEEDLPETIRRLDVFLPFTPDRLMPLVETVTRARCRLVLCDIAPLGIAVARQAGLSAILIENFTWDWIYAGYSGGDGRLQAHAAALARVFDQADYRVQTEPICETHPAANLTTAPVSRQIRIPAEEVRRQLGLPEGAKTVLLTMGGIPWQYAFLEQLTRQPDVYFIIPGATEQVEHRKNLVLLPHYSGFFHPDLVNACDALIGKVGYSTVAEVYQAGLPFGYIGRPRFRESPVLSAYIARTMPGLPIDEDGFQEGTWLERLPHLLALPRAGQRDLTGPSRIADFVADRLKG